MPLSSGHCACMCMYVSSPRQHNGHFADTEPCVLRSTTLPTGKAFPIICRKSRITWHGRACFPLRSRRGPRISRPESGWRSERVLFAGHLPPRSLAA
eukprot:2945517-Rhodomonas_salina.1